MSKRKPSKKRAVINWNVRIQILLFVTICFYMARCTALEKQVRIGKDQPTVTESGKKDLLTKRKEIVNFAKKYVGTGYKYAGKNPKGFDCSGFVYFVMNHFGIDLPGGSRHQENLGKKIAVKEVRPGDLIFFRRTKEGTVFHVSLVISNGINGIQVIHSTSSRGVVIDNIQENNYWKVKIKTARNVVD